MANTSLSVALVLTAVSNIAPIFQQAQRNLSAVGQTVRQTQNDFDQYNKKVKEMEDQVKSFQKVQQDGIEQIQEGLLMLAPVEEAARQAAKFQSAMKKVEIANFDAAVPLEEQQRMLEQLSAQATKLGADTVFSNLEAAQAQNTLIRNGMEYIDVMNGGAQASLYLAQTAEIAPTEAADAISQITNMYQLQGDQLMFVADQVNRAANASSAGVQNIMQDLQQAGSTAHTLGLKIKDTAMIMGVLHNMGLGDSSGTYLNDMLINLDKGTQKAQKALQNMGWLEGATVKYTASGTAKIIGGENSLFNEKGEIKSAEELVKKLRSVLYVNSDLKPEDLRDASGQILPEERINELMEAKNKLEALQNLKDVFGIQGMRAAIALATPGKGSYEDMVAKAERAKAIQDQVLEWQGTLIGKLETMKGSWETLLSESGSPLVKELSNSAQWFVDLINNVSTFANTHPLVTKWALKIFGGFALVKIGAGALMWVFGGAGGFITGTASKLMAATRYARGFYDTFKYFRQGAGIFRSLWAAVSFGYPALANAGALVAKFGGGLLRLGLQALLTGARLAAAWLIGLGPIGWIILGVSAAVALAVAAWKTNFGGFRDWIIGWAQKIVDIINRVRTALGMKPWEVNLGGKASSMSDFKQLEYQPHATGGFITRPHLGLVGEAGPEAIIPLGSYYRDRALQLYRQIGSVLGVRPYALGGIVMTGAVAPPISKMLASYQDNRQYIFHINNPDPKAAAREVAKVIGVPDKYTKSRDPRLQNPTPAIA